MIIVTTLYNAAPFIEQCIGSIMGQSYKNFKCYITDDISTDNSVSLVRNLIDGDDRFVLIENKEKMFQPGNYDQVIRHNESIGDDDVIVEIDGDDWLPNSKVLQYVHDLYSDPEVWITNGSFRYSNGQHGFSSKQHIGPNMRALPMTCSHLRTWRAFLWRNIEVDDLKDENGQYWHVTGDLSFMYPMLEMSGDEHYRFVTENLYVYNEANPLNDHKVNMSTVNVVAQKIRAKQPYKKLIKE